MDEVRELILHERARLRAIQERLAKKTEKPEQKAKQKPILSTSELPKKEQSPQEPADLSAIHRKKTAAYSEMNRLHAQLQLLPSDEERRMAALRILELDEQIQQYWGHIHYYEQHGELPKRKLLRGEPDFEHDSAAELIKKRNNARAYVSKNAAQAAFAEKLSLRKEWIQQINEFLKQ